MSQKNIKELKSAKGFTIVELLIVIVVIGILAAITLVAYNGVQNRAKTTSAQSAANSAVKKAEIYAADSTAAKYPLLGSDLTSAAATTTYQLTGVTIGTAAPITATGTNTLRLIKCGSGTPGTQALITATNIVGNRYYYYNYTNNNADSFFTAGVDSGTGIACPTS